MQPDDTTPSEPSLGRDAILAIRYAGTTCARCGGQRWPYWPWPEPYLCQRCQQVLAGGNVRDPRPVPATPDQERAWAEAGERLRAIRMHRADEKALRTTPQSFEPLEQGGGGGAASVQLDSQAVPTTCYRHRGCFPANLNRLGCPACIAIASGREPDEVSDAGESGAPAAGWNRIRAVVKRRDGYRCQRCGARMPLTVHHIRPREHGETDDFRNLVTLCVRCHDDVEPDEPAAG